MTEILADVYLYRGIERWMIVVGGLIFAYLGYKLFLYGVDQGNGKLEAENQLFKLTFSGSGPGLFFMAFGALVLVYVTYADVSYTRESQSGAARPDDAAGSSPAVFAAAQPSTQRETLSFTSNGAAGACDFIRLGVNAGSVADALDAYKTVQDMQAGSEIAALARALETAGADDDVLRRLMLAIEEVICVLEQ